MNKKGFTLVEVLVVVAILGILVLIAVPNVINSYKNSKDTNFVSEAQAVYKSAKNAYVLDKAKGYNNLVYSNFGSENSRMLDISSRQGFKYRVEFTASGAIVSFNVYDDDHAIDLEDETNGVQFADINKNNVIVSYEDSNNPTNPSNPSGGDDGNKTIDDGNGGTPKPGTLDPTKPETGNIHKCPTGQSWCGDHCASACTTPVPGATY